MSRLVDSVAPPARGEAEPLQSYLSEQRERVESFYNELGTRQHDWNRKFRYFRDGLIKLIKHFVPAGASVLDIGCGTGDLLEALDTKGGVGVDCSPVMVDLARQSHAGLTFVEGRAESLAESNIPDGPYDYVTLVNVVGEMSDIGTGLRQIHHYCSAETRVIIVQYNYLWEPICRLAAKFGLRLDNPTPNWLSPQVLKQMLYLNGFEVVRQGHMMPLPIRIPGLNWLFNSFLGRIQGFRVLGFQAYVVARPIVPLESPDQYTCSVVVPCKDEEDNIDSLVKRIPEMGSRTDIIFVDDKSTDETALRVQNAIERNPSRNIHMVEGPGLGKGAACRAGFKVARGDVLMILDADMTVMPEELPFFFEAITTGKGEFINGSRMVYPQEDQAMRPLNILGNKIFATLFTLLLEQPIRDTLCGTKVIWRRDYAKIMRAREYLNSCDVWGDYDWIFGAVKNNLKIVELPVHYRERAAGETKMNKRLRNGWTMLKMCFVAFKKLRWI